MNFIEAIISGFQNYVNFSGRAIRSEYWFWTLFAILVSIVTSALDYLIFPHMDLSPINSLASLALFLPGLAVSIRRLHDLDRTGWWILILLTVIGVILLLVLIWGPGRSTRNLVTIVVLFGLATIGLEILRRQTIREFPNAEHGESALGGKVTGRGDSAAGPPAGPGTGTGSST